ncbi:MAG: hypothetical protein A3K90_01360 [Pelodictyon luteolum]|uniref:Uncharacterized protein n=1 Tax=Pelodictyon luteolum TaxID=1100 RepID=A0A165L098_PELLU|nr:MAG: hypothetical protein A3K90_01360 [Pelodictyon luteolum]
MNSLSGNTFRSGIPLQARRDRKLFSACIKNRFIAKAHLTEILLYISEDISTGEKSEISGLKFLDMRFLNQEYPACIIQREAPLQTGGLEIACNTRQYGTAR